MSPLFGKSVPPDYVDRFYQEVEAIRVSTELSAQLVPQQIAALSEKLTESFDVYKDAGKPSRPEAADPQAEGWSGWSTADDRTARAQLPTPGRRPSDINEAETEGTFRPHMGAGWQDRVNLGGLGDVLPLPRYPGAEPNAADLLNYTSMLSANLAQKRQNKIEAQRQTTYDQLLEQSGGDFSKVKLSDFDKLTNEPSNLWGSLSNALTTAESGYAQGRYIKGILSKVTRPFSNLNNLGFETGAQGGSPSIFGLRAPWDPATIAGIEQRMSRIGMSFGNNAVTPGQANTIMTNLYSQGWMDTNSNQVQGMRTASQQMMRNNPYIASMPQYYEMMDQATRQGASSLQHFNDVMKGIPDSAKAAHVSIAQTMADMDQLGQQAKQTGGNYINGLENAQTWQNITGLPGGVMGTLMQNPMVVGQTFMRSGLLPWEQGLASPGQHIQGILGALNIMSHSIRTPGNLQSQIGNSGFYNQVSGQDQKEALMAKLMGVDKSTIHTMLNNQHGWMVGQQISDEANAYSRQVRNLIRSGNLTAASKVLTGHGKGTWGQLHTDLGAALDSEGKHIFNKHDLNWVSNVPKTQTGEGHWGGIQKGARFARTWIPGQVKTLDAAQMANERMRRIQDVIAKDTAKHGATGSQSGPQLTIELGPAAKKMFHLQDPNGAQKAAAGAGSVSMNTNSWANGPTYAPTPNLDTASPSYNYGSQYATGTY